MTPLQRENTVKALAFSLLKGINRSTAAQLLACCGSVDSFFASSAESLRATTHLRSELLTEDYRRELIARATSELAFIESNNLQMSFSIMPDLDESPIAPYPGRLEMCDDGPAVLFSLGKCDISKMHTVGIVGTRHSTVYGNEFTSRLVSELAEKVDNIAIISGLAYGIDVAAHRAALKAGIPTIGVLAHGLNTIYPAQHRQVAASMVRSGGMLVTEYPSFAATHQGNFLARNRIVAGLCDCVVVVESDEHGGAMSTARIAAAYSREVMAVPGRVTDRYSSGCNRIIANQLASMIRNADDLISLMQWPVKQTEGQQRTLAVDALSSQQLTVLNHIKANPDDTVNEMCMKLSLPYNSLTNILFTLEMDEYIVQVPGGRYAVVAATSPC